MSSGEWVRGWVWMGRNDANGFVSYIWMCVFVCVRVCVCVCQPARTIVTICVLWQRQTAEMLSPDLTLTELQRLAQQSPNNKSILKRLLIKACAVGVSSGFTGSVSSSPSSSSPFLVSLLFSPNLTDRAVGPSCHKWSHIWFALR